MNVDVSSHEFDDPDAFREHISGWDTEVVPLGRGGLRIRWDKVAYEDMALAHLAARGTLADASAVHADWMGFVVCLAPVNATWCGVALKPGHLKIMAPGREQRCYMEGWRSFEIALSATVIESMCILADSGPNLRLGPERCVLSLDRRQATSFEALARSLATLPILEEGLRDAMLGALRERSLELLGSALATGTARRRLLAPVRRIARYDLAVRALAIMDGCDGAPPTVAEIAGRLNTTPRALQYALKSAIGVSPYQYLLARRLQLVRRDLVRKRTNITTAAFDHGFENLGRFASQYARLFGEKPSQTLRRICDAGTHANGHVAAVFAE